MGPSGSGKTTLLDVLAGRKTAGRIEGEVLFAGQHGSRAFLRRYCGYVEQVGPWRTGGAGPSARAYRASQRACTRQRVLVLGCLVRTRACAAHGVCTMQPPFVPGPLSPHVWLLCDVRPCALTGLLGTRSVHSFHVHRAVRPGSSTRCCPS